MTMQIRASRCPYSFGEMIDLRLFDPEARKFVKFASVELVAVEPGDAVEIPPALQIKKSDAQMLIDTLWDCGLRPTEGSGSAGALLATQEHLQSMKEMATRLLAVVERNA